MDTPPNHSGFGTFWYGGALSAMERASAESFIARGNRLTIFSYELITNAPAGAVLEDAAAIVPQPISERFLFNNKPHLGHFSDFFRYRMIALRRMIWVDLDIILLADIRIDAYREIIAAEERGGINGAVLYTEDQKLLQVLTDECTKLMGKNLKWGETGPLLREKVIKKQKFPVSLSAYHLFYPIEYYDIYKIFLPEHRDECKHQCRDALTLHLFNNIVRKIGYWKEIAPPEGSFLHGVFADARLLGLFRDTYPATVMRGMLENYRLRLNGKDLGIRTIMREAIPSVMRTYRHYYPAGANS